MSKGREGEGRTVLITGASAGIGTALANVFARQGFDLAVTARRADRLNALKTRLEAAHGVRVHAIPADLAQPQASPELAQSLREAGVTIDGLVNNAGYNFIGFARSVCWADKRALLQVMAIAPYELTHYFLPPMHERGYGRILNVASVVGLVPGSVSNTLYAGVKKMQVGFSEALHAEERASGVHVTVLCPGLTYSEFHDVDGSRAQMRSLPGFLWQSAERVAEAGYAAVMRNDAVCIPGLFNRLLTSASRLAPRKIAYALSARASRAQRNTQAGT